MQALGRATSRVGGLPTSAGRLPEGGAPTPFPFSGLVLAQLHLRVALAPRLPAARWQQYGRRAGRGLGGSRASPGRWRLLLYLPADSGTAARRAPTAPFAVRSAEQLEKLLYLLESTDDPIITEKALVTLGNNAAFSTNQAIIRELGGIPIVGSKINSLNQSIKEKALNALNNLSVNVENQTKIKVQVLKLLLNLSENPAMTEGLLSAQVDSSFLSLYDGQMANEILLRALTLFQNINNCLRVEGRLANQLPFAKGSLFFLLYGEECAQKMKALACHPDVDVKEKALAIKPKF
ncbi:similar to RIKEN cDNA 2810037C14, isoform CRA_b [Rattus norvegicus]|uniref:Similar to RIKEN cDNA 2810037C14, isoform CRA_b n=1 Tax=Rattus norvegicus TaxID=10116 RepID=A6K5B3_RAT|nr:similar to RIKEN cDNA 2810037C14, isoform CRA_b [Rattus norvegicus]